MSLSLLRHTAPSLEVACAALGETVHAVFSFFPYACKGRRGGLCGFPCVHLLAEMHTGERGKPRTLAAAFLASPLMGKPCVSAFLGGGRVLRNTGSRTQRHGVACDGWGFRGE